MLNHIRFDVLYYIMYTGFGVGALHDGLGTRNSGSHSRLRFRDSVIPWRSDSQCLCWVDIFEINEFAIHSTTLCPKSRSRILDNAISFRNGRQGLSLGNISIILALAHRKLYILVGFRSVRKVSWLASMFVIWICEIPCKNDSLCPCLRTIFG